MYSKGLAMFSRKIVFCVLAVMFTFLNSFADMDKVGKYNLGAAAGFSTGYGISYRQWFDNKGLQITTAPVYYRQGDEIKLNLSLGLTGLYRFREATLVDLFGYASTHYSHEYSQYPWSAAAERSSYHRFIVAGIGPGIDFHFLTFSFSLMLGLAFIHQFDHTKTGLNFTGETALYYSF